MDEIKHSGCSYPLSCVDPTVNKNRGAGRTVSSRHLNTEEIPWMTRVDVNTDIKSNKKFQEVRVPT